QGLRLAPYGGGSRRRGALWGSILARFPRQLPRDRAGLPEMTWGALPTVAGPPKVVSGVKFDHVALRAVGSSTLRWLPSARRSPSVATRRRGPVGQQRDVSLGALG